MTKITFDINSAGDSIKLVEYASSNRERASLIEEMYERSRDYFLAILETQISMYEEEELEDAKDEVALAKHALDFTTQFFCECVCSVFDDTCSLQVNMTEIVDANINDNSTFRITDVELDVNIVMYERATFAEIRDKICEYDLTIALFASRVQVNQSVMLYDCKFTRLS